MKYLLLSLLIVTEALAHGERDWRTDIQAYLAVEVELPVTTIVALEAGRIQMDYFKEKLKVFAMGERKSPQGLDQARAFLKKEYEALGFVTSHHPFGGGINFIAEKKGSKDSERVLILSSHIDSVGNIGANDNATGTIGALTIARELSKNEYPFTIRIVGFDREERGMQGSAAYVATISDKRKIIGNINLEMLGYHAKNDGGFHLIDCDKNIIWNVSQPFSDFLSAEVRNSILALALDLHVVKTCTGRSDHASFWEAKIPAIVISENFFGGDADPCYHSKCDVLDERINYEYIAKILEASLHAVEKLLQKSPTP